MNELFIKEKIKQFLLEDIQHEDLTSDAIFPSTQTGTASLYAKNNGILAGVDLIKTVYNILDDEIDVQLFKTDGDELKKGERIATISGKIRSILSGERVILNLLQRMSGIATITNKAVKTLDNPNIKITDTRKTTPGLRLFEKYAVRCGGGYNHRFGLYDAVMIKDNHIAFCGSIEKAVAMVRKKVGPTVKIEVETETISEVKEAVAQQVDIIMFDNRTPDEIIEMQKYVPDHILTEASGGITLENLHLYRHTNVDFISLGFLTHSVQALDMSLTIEGGIF
ncbi:MAG: carboxylating nicotinate-nucleotide diphosphorylase [Bacilli bacterium]|nr:carboxylating nicotinate-nucleotide diphosphorylase [Bacilli bacterium]